MFRCYKIVMEIAGVVITALKIGFIDRMFQPPNVGAQCNRVGFFLPMFHGRVLQMSWVGWYIGVNRRPSPLGTGRVERCNTLPARQFYPRQTPKARRATREKLGCFWG